VRRTLKYVLDTQSHWACELCPSFGIVSNYKIGRWTKSINPRILNSEPTRHTDWGRMHLGCTFIQNWNKLFSHVVVIYDVVPSYIRLNLSLDVQSYINSCLGQSILPLVTTPRLVNKRAAAIGRRNQQQDTSGGLQTSTSRAGVVLLSAQPQQIHRPCYERREYH
jgi:hypothetical protein